MATSRKAGGAKPAPNTEMDVRAGRRAPTYTDIKDWVPLSGASPQAVRLYNFYRMHVNRKRGDGLAWPTLETVALALGLSRGDKATAYMQELDDLGGITATRQGQEDGRYLILVHEEPPPGYTGPVTLEEWYQQNKVELDARRDSAKARRAAQRERSKAGRAADTPKTGNPPESPSRGYPESPPAGYPESPSRGAEPDEPNQDEENHPLTPVQDPAGLSGPAAVGEDSRHEANPPADALVEELCTIKPRWSRAAVRRVIDEELAAGVAPVVLAEAARRCAADPATRAPGRIREAGPWWDEAAQAIDRPAPWPAWCGDCHEPTRLTNDDQPARCPNCHPKARTGVPA